MKIVYRSEKSQCIFLLLMSGNPVETGIVQLVSPWLSELEVAGLIFREAVWLGV